MEIRGQEVIGVKLTVEKIEKEKEEEAFESWVTGGYFEGDYIPYSFIEDGKIVFNVSANQVTLSDVLQRMGVEFHKCRPGFTLLRMTGICALQNIIMEVMTTGCFILDRN